MFKLQDDQDSRLFENRIPKFLLDNVSGNPIKMAHIHKSWHKHIYNHKFSLIIAPRDHGKSEQIAIGRVLCEIGKNPNIRIKLFSGKNDLANKRVKAITKYIERSEKYHDLYRNITLLNKNKSAITVDRDINSKEPTLESYGIMAAATGDRADLIICDDVCTFENTIAKPAVREIVKEKFYNDIMNLLEPDGRLIYICTLWHQDDLSSELIKNRDTNGFALLFQAIPADLTPLWHEKWTLEALKERRAANPRAFDRGFRNIPLSDVDALFPRDLISNCIFIGNPIHHTPVGQTSRLSSAPVDGRITVPVDGRITVPVVNVGACAARPGFAAQTPTSHNVTYKCYVGVDLAIGRGESNDYTVIFVLAVHPDSALKIPLEIIRRKMTSPETARTLIDVCKRHQPNLIFVENNAYQDSLIQWIRESGDVALPIEGFMTGKQKFDEFIGLPSLAAEFANNGWAIYNHQNPLAEGSSPCKCSFCTFIDELVNFPIAKHDDTIMAAWFAREAARKNSRGAFDLW